MLSEKHRRPAARLFEDVALYDYRKGKKIALEARPFILEAFQETWELQEKTKEEMRKRAEWVEGQVRALEKASWDRKDAVEL